MYADVCANQFNGYIDPRMQHEIESDQIKRDQINNQQKKANKLTR